MLHELLTANRAELISRCREKAATRSGSEAIPPVIDHGVPLFLQQLVGTLRFEASTSAREGGKESPALPVSEISRGAASHGAEMLRLGYTVDQVVREYGDVCQSVTDMAVEQKAAISADEFRTLNRCLDDAIADAVTSFGAARQRGMKDGAEDLHYRLDYFSDEYRRLVAIAIQAYSAIRTGNVGVTGATGTLLVHTLEALQSLAERTLPDIQLASAATTVA